MNEFYYQVINKVIDKVGDQFGREGNESTLLTDLRNVRIFFIF